MVNTFVKGDINEQEPGMETVNINLMSFNSNHSTKITKLKTSSKQATIILSYKVDIGCNGNLALFNIFKTLFLTQQQVDWWQQKIHPFLKHMIAQINTIREMWCSN